MASILTQSTCLVHGDIKPLNVVRTDDGGLKLIDLDAAVKIGGQVTEKYSEVYMSPEYAQHKFREENFDEEKLKSEIKELKNQEKELEKPGEKIAIWQKIDSKEKHLKAHQNKNTSSTPFSADVSLDIWAFGATVYHMCTGEPLFSPNEQTKNGSMKDENGKAVLMNWDGLDKKTKNKILPNCNEQTRNGFIEFLSKCLHKNPVDRFQSMKKVLEFELNFVTTKAIIGEVVREEVKHVRSDIQILS